MRLDHFEPCPPATEKCHRHPYLAASADHDGSLWPMPRSSEPRCVCIIDRFSHFNFTIFGYVGLFWGKCSCHGVPKATRLPSALFCPVVLLLSCEDIPDHRSWAEDTERGRGGTAVPGRSLQQVTGRMGSKLR